MTVELVQAKAESDALERSPERSVSALDGRYRDLTSELGDHVSEWALIKHRTRVEVEWLIRLSDLPEIAELRALSDDERSFLRDLVCCFDDEDARAVKRWEKITNHDVKAVEYYLRDRMASAGLEDVVEFVHFASTSEDVNNLAHGLMLKGAVAEAWRPAASALVDAVATIAFETRATAILSQTHGQPASPSTFGKEMAVFVHRWRKQLAALDRIEYLGKSNGAVGTYGAHLIAYPTVDWEAVARAHVEALGLTWSPLTTQIESHDWIAELFHVIGRFNAILLDFDHRAAAQGKGVRWCLGVPAGTRGGVFSGRGDRGGRLSGVCLTSLTLPGGQVRAGSARIAFHRDAVGRPGVAREATALTLRGSGPAAGCASRRELRFPCGRRAGGIQICGVA
jgi:hypothetical protein